MEKTRSASNAHSLFQVRKIPTDNHIRKTLDPVCPTHLHDLFDDLLQAFDQQGVLEAMRARSVHHSQLIALDGTWYFSSQSNNIHCPHCSSTHHPNGSVTHYHSAITPVIVSPGSSQVLPLRPEFITPQDGHDKQDCEIAAAKRWIANYSSLYAKNNPTLLGDDLYAHEPFCRMAMLYGFHFLFTCKPTSHTHLAGWIADLEPGKELSVLKERVRIKSNRYENREYSWFQGAPLTQGADALKVNWLSVRIEDDQGKELYRCSWITDWPVDATHVAELVASARARWKIENENNNVLKTKGYHLEHNFGHGKKHLSSLLLTMNILAFGLHTLLEIADSKYQLVRETLGRRDTFFEHIRALTHYMYFEDWESLMDFMIKGLEAGPYAKEDKKKKK
jgi:hypothetical protein